MDLIFYILLVTFAANVTIDTWHKSKAKHSCKQEPTETEE